jgi:guanine deaminase
MSAADRSTHGEAEVPTLRTTAPDLGRRQKVVYLVSMNESFMQRALEMAVQNVEAGQGGPFAALVVRDNEIVGEGTNLVTSTNDPTAHAEIVAIRSACARLNTFQLEGCEIYATCEPCPMCLGAIYWARPDRVFFAATQQDAAQAGFDDAFIYREIARPWADREIPMHRLICATQHLPFEAWRRFPGRIEY